MAGLGLLFMHDLLDAAQHMGFTGLNITFPAKQAIIPLLDELSSSSRPLHAEASALAPAGTTYTWIPRDRNAYADRLANEALDGVRSGVTVAAVVEAVAEELTEKEAEEDAKPPARGWGGPGVATTLVLLRHGVTTHTSAKRFSGGLGGDNPPLSDEGRDQVRAAGEWLAPLAERVDVVVASPVRRTRESADIVADCRVPVTLTFCTWKV